MCVIISFNKQNGSNNIIYMT